MVSNYAVLGSPIEHSKSPLIHKAAYRVLGLDWEYQKLEVREGGLRNFLDSLDSSWQGLSLTMPLKEEAFRIAVSLDTFAQRTHAVNTLHKTVPGWAGFNTDVFGIVQSLKQGQLQTPSRVLVIGSGATAKSAVTALVEIAPKAKISIHARNETAKLDLAKYAIDLGFDVVAARNLKREIRRADLTISTVPAGALDDLATKLMNRKLFTPKGALFDVVYKDWPTDLAKLWISRDLKAISGLEMLIWQAVAQIRIFTTGNSQTPLPNEAAVLAAMRHAVSN